MPGSGVRGDFARLVRLQRQLEAAASGRFKREMNEALAKEAVRLVQAGVRSGRDPYGTPWPRTTEGKKPLQRYAGTFTASVRGSGFVVRSRKPWLQVHQTGKKIRAKRSPFLRFRVGGRWVQTTQVTIPARPVVPTRGRGFGPIWRPALQAAAAKILKKHLGR
jgi:hypothetical protein